MVSLILVVSREPNLVQSLRPVLQEVGYDVEAAPDGQAAAEKLDQRRPDLVVLDLAVVPPSEAPDAAGDGWEVYHRLRQRSDAPVIMLGDYAGAVTASDVITALEHGVDDYLDRPISVRELVARVKAVLRRRLASAGEAGRPHHDHQPPHQHHQQIQPQPGHA
ncbi:MAG TPA: response regulator [Chloroflexota bacterium]|nr:response regulator [Chloroflexota bacterium]